MRSTPVRIAEGFSIGAISSARKILLILIGLSLGASLISIIGFSLRDWDEGVFVLQGQWLTSGFSQGKPYNFQTPPLYPFVAGLSMRLIGGNPAALPIVSFLFSIATLFVVYYAGRVFYDSDTAFFAPCLLASTELFHFFSKSGLSDAVFLFFFTFAFFNMIRNRRGRLRYFILSGVFITLAMYTKYSGAALLAVAIVVGIVLGLHRNWRWYAFQIALPVLFFSPLVFLYAHFGRASDTGQRLLELFGFNYHRHLYYLIVFAPTTALIGIIAQFKPGFGGASFRMTTLASVIYLALLGVYYPYFRLGYPLIMLLALNGAALKIDARFKTWIILAAAAIGTVFSLPTIMYRNRVPADFGGRTREYVHQKQIRILYSSVPPNIEYYLQGDHAIPDNHPWYSVASEYPALGRGRRILHRSDNELEPGEEILIAHASINDSLKSALPEIFSRAELIFSSEFIDAPLYLKDIFHRSQAQRFELYRLRIDDSLVADMIWKIGFRKGISVLVY